MNIIRNLKDENNYEKTFTSGYCFWFGDLNFRLEGFNHINIDSFDDTLNKIN